MRTSKFLSLILRHKPEAVGIELDAEGWVEVDALLTGMASRGHALSFPELVAVVKTNDKRRFAFNHDRTKIRAVQGHSRKVALGYTPAPPPDRLFHGTVERFISAIRANGLMPGRRQHVHLSASRGIAEEVGRRRGRPVILTVDSRAMAANGHLFYLADNGLWLAAQVPAAFVMAWT